MAAQRAQPAAREPAGLPAGERGLAGRDGGNGGAESVSGGVEGAVGRPAGTGLAAILFSRVEQAIAFCGLLRRACGPRNFMKKVWGPSLLVERASGPPRRPPSPRS